MITIILSIHILLAIALVIAVLLQRSEGGALGIGGGGGMGGFMTGRATANALTRATAILAGCFIATSIVLAVFVSGGSETRSVVDEPEPAASEPVAPAPPEGPIAPSR